MKGLILFIAIVIAVVGSVSAQQLVLAVGIRFRVANNKAITLTLGYNYHTWSASIPSVNTDAVTLRLGYSF